MIDNKKQKIDLQKETITRILNQKLENNKNILDNPTTLYKEKIILLNTLIEKLELVNPLGILKRGYSLTSQDNKVITSIKNINKEKPLLIKMQDGEIEAKITKIKE